MRLRWDAAWNCDAAQHAATQGAQCGVVQGCSLRLHRSAAWGCARVSGELRMVAGCGCAWAQHGAAQGAAWGCVGAQRLREGSSKWLSKGRKMRQQGPSMRPRWSARGRGLGLCWGARAAEGAPCGVAQGRSMRLRMGEAWGTGGA